MVKTHTFNAEGASLMPGWGTKILHAVGHGQKIKKGKMGLELESSAPPRLPSKLFYTNGRYSLKLIIL